MKMGMTGAAITALIIACSARCLARQTFATPTYTAELNSGGMLTSLRVHGSELLRGPLVLGDGVKWSVDKLDTASAGQTRVALKSDHGTGQIDYQPGAKRLIMSLTQKTGGFSNWHIPFGDDVVAVENLQNVATSGAEVIQYREQGEIRALPLTRLSRVQRARLYLRGGGTVLFWHDGWGAPFNVDEMGGFSGFTYGRGLLDNDHPMKVVFEPEERPSPALQPSPPFVATADAFAGLTLAGEPAGFTVRFADPEAKRLRAAPRWRLSWIVRDFFDRTAATGSTDFDGATVQASRTVHASVPVKSRGWLTVVFSVAPVLPVSPAPAPSEFRTRFAVIDRDAALPAIPPAGEHATDYTYMGLIGATGMRESHTLREFYPERGKISEAPLEQLFANASREAARWGCNWFFQANERPAWCTDAEYEQIAYDLVTRAHGRCRTWEVENEPNFRYSPADYVKKALIPFAKGAKRADPTCKILAPACVAVPITLQFVDAIIAAGAMANVDAISTHTYMGPGEPWELFGNPEYLEKLRGKIGHRQIWQTEQGYTWSHSSRQEQARYAVRQYLNGAAEGITSAYQYYFYPVHNGFEPWYLVESGSTDGLNGTYEPAGIALRVLNEQTGGMKAGKREEPLTGLYTLRYAGTDHDIVAIWTLDYALSLTLKGAIDGATDVMGNPITLTKAAGGTALAVDGYARYLRVRRGQPLAIVSPSFGRNVVAAGGAAVHASSETKDHPASAAVDGRWAMRDAAPGLATRTYWESAVMRPTEAKPDWLQIDFPSPHTISRALLLTPLPAVDGGVPRDYSIEVSQDGSHWVRVAAARDWVGWAGMLTFHPVKASHVRLVITKLNDGWHLDGRWEYMVADTFTRYTSMQCRVLDLMLFGE